MSKIEVDAIDKQSGSTLTLGGSGTAVTLACGATQTGFGRTGTVDWNTTKKTGDFTATNGSGFFVDTNGGTITATLPASPSAGNIVAIKEAIGDLDRIKQLVDICEEKINILSGDDLTAKDALLLGGKGVITVTGNIAPKFMHLMCKAAIEGDRKLAEEYDNKIIGLHRDLFLESNPIPVKWALNKMGLIKEGIRLPLTIFSEEHHEKLLSSMKMAEV